MKLNSIVIFSVVVTCVGIRGAFSQVPFIHPKIQSHGKVVRLADAAEQPRNGSRICVDVTAAGPIDGINPAIEKLARFVNIYAGAGEQPADVHITAVLHGKSTTVALTDEAYSRRHATKGNPNLPLLRKLRNAGVEFFVCGQSAAGLGVKDSEVTSEVQVAVSALTVNVNRQTDGFAFIPLQ